MENKYEVHIEIDYNAYVMADSKEQAERRFWDLLEEELDYPIDFKHKVTDVEFDYISASTELAIEQ